jgi:Zn-dependent M28 family amino/carboxypeptidase
MGSNAHAQVVTWINAQLKNMGWTTDIQTSTWNSQPIQNIIARRGQGHPWIILGAHFDCRSIADQDPDPNKRSLPVLGANDSASGVAVLLELARVLPYKNKPQVWMVFFDAEDNFNIPGWGGDIGSSAFVQKLNDKPDELNSDQKISIEIWKQAAELGYKQFISIEKYRIIDDHVPFLEMGIPAVDIIDFNYPYWHTTMDTLDKISSASLQAVGDTLQKWILGK